MNYVFVDTSYLLALELANDKYHPIALAHWQQILHVLPQLITTTYVFDEIVTFFNHRGYHSKAVQVGTMLLRSPSVKLIHVDEILFYKSWAYLQKYHDKGYSFTDCLSFVVMQDWSIDIAFSFDNHFSQAGFTRIPE